MTADDTAPPPPFIGLVEPLAGRLTSPIAGQRLYKLMTVENLLRSIEGSYLHFNRIDAYRDFPDADAVDGAELPSDQSGNAAASFEKAPDFTLSDYYARSRGRTYACCFSLENSEQVWSNYGRGSTKGQVGLVFDFDKLRQRLNNSLAYGEAMLMIGDIPCHQVFSINYGVISYVSRDSHRANAGRAPNPIDYAYLKDERFRNERELRVSLSALGMGHFVLADGTRVEFPVNLAMAFDFRDAFADGTIIELLSGESTDASNLAAELEKLGLLARGSATA